MKKRFFSLALCILLCFSMVCPSVLADDSVPEHEHKWVDCGINFDGEVKEIPVSVSVQQCSVCKMYLHSFNILGNVIKYPAITGYTTMTNELVQFLAPYVAQLLGKNATAEKAPSGIGRKDLPGYNNYDTGTPAVNPDGTYSGNFAMVYDGYVTPFKSTISRFTFDTKSDYSNGSSSSAGDGNVSAFAFYDDFPALSNVCVRTFYYFQAPVTGYYDITIPSISVSAKAKAYNGNYYSNFATYARWFLYVTRATSSAYYEPTSSSTNKADYRESYKLISGNYEPEFTTDSVTRTFYVTKGNIIQCGYTGRVGVSMSSTGQVWQSIAMQTAAPTIVCRSYADSSDNKLTNQANITINNNTWNGNIYTDNSTNLTYIYPQYTTINEKNETVTNISNTPIIYNNETKKYYTYDTVTNNYYYITYELPATPTPSPSPSPAPTETPSPSESPAPTPTSTPKPGGGISTPETGKPGGDTGDTTGILAVLVEIRDNMIQGFLDIKAAFVAGFAELSANFTLAIENLNVNIQNIFNKKFPDQSTPETAQPTPTPSPEPTETPSPTEPSSPTPSPSPAPTGKPDGGGDTNNFWNIFIGGGSDDGTDGDHKGIFWALISLILALIAFFTNLFAGVAYLFPFLPEGVVMTINTCLFVVFLFVIIKFIMRSK